MKATIIQLDIEWGSPQSNIDKVERLIAQVPVSDLYILPEMWSTGFATEPHEIAEQESSSISLQWMREKANRLHCAICGSLAIRLSDHDYRNRHYFIDGRNGAEYYYDKHHLFRYGGENKYYQPGREHTIVDYCGFKILLLTCYDLRFPVWSRFSNHLQYDVIVVVANWPESRQNAWQILTHARAMENQAFLIGCNRVGDDQYSHYKGNSTFVSPIGKSLQSCKSNIEETATFELNIDIVHHQRSKFRVLEDRDIY